MSKYNSQAPYIASYMIFTNDKNEVAFLLRSNTSWMDGYYTLPSGKVEPDEFFIACAVREAKEEVGVDVLPEDAHMSLIMHRSEPDGFWVDAYITIHKWQGDLHNAEPHVHGNLAWFALDELPKNIVPGVRVALEQIAKGKTYYEYTREDV